MQSISQVSLKVSFEAPNIPSLEMSTDEQGENPGAFIDPSDVLAEVGDDGDIPMREDHLAEENDDDIYEVDEGSMEGDAEANNTSIAQFTGHSGSVFAVAVHPTQPIVVSGGEDDLGYIWDLKTGAEIVKLTGHTDSVTAVDWSSDGELVSTGGMDGKVRIWRHVRRENDDWKTWEFLTELTGPEEVIVRFVSLLLSSSSKTMMLLQWLEWHPRGFVLLAGSNDSTVWLWQRTYLYTHPRL